MKCPFCGHLETQVVETRVSEDGDFVRRRRQCGACEKRFTTYERPDVNFPVVVKKDGSRADFDAAKVRASMMLALRKRPVGIEQIDIALLRIEQELLSSGLRESIRPRSANWSCASSSGSTRWPTCASPRCTAASRTWTSSGNCSGTS